MSGSENKTGKTDISESILDYLKATLVDILDVGNDVPSGDESFLELGINSLRAVRLLVALREKFNIKLGIEIFFDYETPAQLARSIGEVLSAQSNPGFSRLESASSSSRYSNSEVVANRNQKMDIAIIGISGRFPEAESVDEFWENLCAGRDCITEIDRNGWVKDQYFNENPEVKNKSISRWCGQIRDFDTFDPLFFNISPKEANLMDPQQRLFLQESYRAIEDAGYAPRSFDGSEVGIFVGSRQSDFFDEAIKYAGINSDVFLGNDQGILGARIAYFLNLKGPCLTIDTACSSGLMAVHLAIQSLSSGECELALAGSVFLEATPRFHILTSQTQMLSPDGKCKTFDNSANGIVPGEAVAVVVLKPLVEALISGDHIYAVVKGSAINQDGRTKGITAPSSKSQEHLLRQAYANSGVSMNSVQYLELHGTGTKLGDPIEFRAVRNAFERADRRITVGSHKPNIGHTIMSAGLVGFIKSALAIQNAKIPPTINFNTINEHIGDLTDRFHINTELEAWPSVDENPRRAGVSSFGFSGTNVHVVLEAAPVIDLPPIISECPQIVLLSAKNIDGVKDQARSILAYLEKKNDFSFEHLYDLAYTLRVGRDSMENRISIQVSSVKQLISALKIYISGEGTVPLLNVGSVKDLALIQRENGGAENVSAMAEDAASSEDMDKLSRLWVKGVDVAWEVLDNKEFFGREPRRISLPTYRFLKRRYWPDQSKSKRVSGEGQSESTKVVLEPELHPLVHTNNFSSLGWEYSSVFHGSEFFFKDHQVDGKKTFPAAAYLEMVRVAFGAAVSWKESATQPISLKRIVIAHPLILVDMNVTINIRLLQKVNSEIFTFTIGDASSDVIFCQGEVSIGEHSTQDIFSVETELERYSFVKSGEPFYKDLQLMGLNYGSTHQSVKSIYYSKNLDNSQLMVQLALPNELLETRGQYVLHPSILDGALQSTVEFLFPEQYPSKPLIPFAIDAVTIIRSLPLSSWAVIRKSLESGIASKSMKIDIDICNEKGLVCTKIHGFSVRSVESNKKGASSDAKAILFEPDWTPLRLSSNSSTRKKSKHCIVLDGFHESQKTLLGNLIPNAEIIELPAGFAGKSIERDFVEYSKDIFKYIKELFDNPDSSIIIQLVVDSSLAAGLVGLFGTVNLETSRIRCQVVELDTQETDIENLASALVVASKEEALGHVSYKSGVAFEPLWVQLESSRCESVNRWKDDSVYLISGGSGKLAEIFTRDIAQNSKSSTVILIGRSPEDKILLSSLNSYKSTKVIYRQCDVTLQDDMSTLISRSCAEFGKISGIIHCAGVLEDAPMKTKTENQWINVLKPKVDGVVCLDQVTKDLQLEFFILCSSIASFGNVGQADYATANAYLDRFSNYRNNLVKSGWRFGKTVSINWPLWEDGGMQVDEGTKLLLKQTSGLVPMPTSVGLEAIHAAMSVGFEQVIVLYGLEKKLSQRFVPRANSFNNDRVISCLSSPISIAKSRVSNEYFQAELISKTERLIVEIIQEILEISEKDIDLDDDFEAYGFDSIGFTNFSNTINNQCGLSLMPTVFFEITSPRSLVEHLISEYQNTFIDLFKLTDSLPVTNTNSQVADLLSNVESLVKSAISDLLEIPERDFALEEEFSDLGFDSISLTSFTNYLNDKYDLSLMPTIFFEYSNSKELVEYLVESQSQKFSSFFNCGEASIVEHNDYLLESTENLVISGISEILQIGCDDISADEEFSEFGFDSISLTSFSNYLNELCDLSLMPTIFFENTSPRMLVDYLITFKSAELSNFFEVDSGVSDSTILASGDDSVPVPVEDIHKIAFERDYKDNFIHSDRSHSDDSRSSRSPEDVDPIAIVGLSCCFPMALDVDAFWDNIKNGQDCISEVPVSRWDWREYYGDDDNQTQIKWGGFIDDADQFDHVFFGISPKEALQMDPQQRLLLMYVWKVIEDAGYSPDSLSGTDTGLFVGTSNTTGYSELVAQSSLSIDGYSTTGMVPSVGPNRVSYLLNLHGPSEPVETACSSSLVAVHRGLLAIKNGHCSQAIVGGINTIATPYMHIGFSKANMLSPDGRCHTFSNMANGYVRGEGVGLLFLKKLSVSESDGNHIYGIIRGSSVNHGGKANSLTAPNPKAQAQLIETAYKNANIDPRRVGYIEAHGTGTKLGDPIEIQGLITAFSNLYRSKNISDPIIQHCGIGSVKTNIGHAELAAGIAGLIKVLLQIKHKTIAKSLHCEDVNPYIKLENSPFYLARENAQWNRFKDDNGQEMPLVGGVSSFGFGGVNSHVVLEEYIRSSSSENSSSDDVGRPYIILLSAKSETSLLDMASELKTYIEKHSAEIQLRDLAYTLQVGRTPMNERVAFLVESGRELINILGQYLSREKGVVQSEKIDNLYEGVVNRSSTEIGLFGDDEDINNTLVTWLLRGKYKKLLNAWVSGFEIDWNNLYDNHKAEPNVAKPQRVSLPTYMFSKQRFWIEDEFKGKPSVGGNLHSLVHTNVSTLFRQRYVSKSDSIPSLYNIALLNELRFLSVFAFLEMVIVSFKFAVAIEPRADAKDLDQTFSPITLTDIHCFYPSSSKINPAGFIIELFPHDHGKANFEVRSAVDIDRGCHESTENSVCTSLCSGTASVVSDSKLKRSPLNGMDISQYELDEHLDKATCCEKGPSHHYQELINSGINVASSDRAITDIYHGESYVLAKLLMGDDVERTLPQNDIHPTVLNGAIHASLILVGRNDGEVTLKDFVSWRIENLDSVTVLAPSEKNMWVLVRNVNKINKNGVVFDLSVFNKEGSSIIQIRGLHIIPGQTEMSDEISADIIKKQTRPRNESYEPGDLFEKISSKIVVLINEIFHVPVSEIDPDARFNNLGFDSIGIQAFTDRVNKLFNIKLIPTVLYEHHTLKRLVKYLESEKLKEMIAYFGVDMVHHTEVMNSQIEKSQRVVSTGSVNYTPARNALLAKMQNKKVITHFPKAANEVDDEGIAIIGMSGCFPMAPTLEDFWGNLLNGRDCISEIPESRWDWQKIFGQEKRETVIKWGGFIEDTDQFDPMFFEISPLEAQLMDPQQRLMLMYVWKVIEDAGYAPSSLSGSNTGVFIGTSHAAGYGELVANSSLAYDGYSPTSMLPSIGPNRVSYFFDFRGPSEPIETSCSSSIVAIQRGVQSILGGQCNQAIVGGVNTITTPYLHIALHNAGMLSPSGRCNAFSTNADGYARGEGVGMLMLKRLSDSEKAGDPIYGVIRGSAVNHGGKANSLTAPNPGAQAEVLTAAYKKSGVDPLSLTYIEAHGTGTELGDPIEIEGLKAAFSKSGFDGVSVRELEGNTSHCGIGSVKSNIGHLEMAAGISGVIKVLLQMKHKTLVKTLHCEHVNPYIDFQDSPFYLVQENRPWERLHDDTGKPLPRRAGVSSFGFGGVNAHVVIEEYIDEVGSSAGNVDLASLNENAFNSQELEIVLLSAKQPQSLRVMAKNLKNHVKANIAEIHLPDVAYTLQIGREAMQERLAIIVCSIEDLVNKLDAFLESSETPKKSKVQEGVYQGNTKLNKEILNRFSHDEDMNLTLSSWFEKRKFDKILPLWVEGLEVDWHTMNGARDFLDCNRIRRPRKIALPTYAFSTKRYWVEINEFNGSADINNEQVLGISENGNSNESVKITSLDKAPVDLTIPEKKTLDESVLEQLTDVFCSVAQLNSETIDEDESFDTYGIDSLMINRLNQKLEENFSDLSKVLFFEYSTLKEFSDYLVDCHREECERWISNSCEATKITTIKDTVFSEDRDNSIGQDRPAIDVSENGLAPVQVSQNKTTNEVVESKFTKAYNEPIAVIGLAGRYPKADNVGEFWKNLESGRDCVGTIPADRWPIEGFFEANPRAAIAEGLSYSKWGGFIDDFACFDPLLFSISPKEAMAMDPQERLFIQACWEALEDAGYSQKRFKNMTGGDVGVFAGITKTGFDLYGPDLWSKGGTLIPHTSFSSLANRVSYIFDLKGPSIAIDTMCSSSLTAVHEACESIWRRDCVTAFAGGVNIYVHPNNYVLLSAYKMLSQDGKCKSFGSNADGFVPGEGVGTVLLKRRADAERDRDNIHALILSTNVNHGGHTNGYTVPNPSSQGELIEKALSKSGIDPRAVSYIEAHGTGTDLGDPIEIAGLQKAFSQTRLPLQSCAIGSVKSNIGHLEAAAGIAGMTKIILQMKHKKLVPTLHCEQANPKIELSKTPFYLQRELKEWAVPVASDTGGVGSRIAGISSFGAGGANAHVILEEYVTNKLEENPGPVPQAILFSAETEGQLMESVERFIRHTSEMKDCNEHSTLQRIATTLQIGRESMTFRLGLVVESVSVLLDSLTNILGQEFESYNDYVYKGSAEEREEYVSIFNNKGDLALHLDKLYESQDLKGLTALWVKGIPVEWERFYRQNKPLSISLPTYPFDKKYLWFSDHKKEDKESDSEIRLSSERITWKNQSVTRLHPLVHVRDSIDPCLRFDSILSPTDFFLDDHRVQGKRVLPGVAYLEMARAAAEISNPEPITVIRNVFWSAAMVVDKKIEVSVELENRGKSLKYKIITEKGGSVTIHSQGELLTKESMIDGSTSSRTRTKKEILEIDYHTTKTRQEIYSFLDSVKFSYGERFKVLTKVSFNESSLLAEYQIPESLTGDFESFLLHPSIMDSALQATTGLVTSGFRATGGKQETKLPFTVKSVEIYSSLGESGYIYVENSRENKSKNTSKYDIDIFDSNGVLCVRLNNFTVRAVESLGPNIKDSPTKDVIDSNGQAAGVYRALPKNILFASPKWELDETPVLPSPSAPQAALFSLVEANSHNSKTLKEVAKYLGLQEDYSGVVEIESGVPVPEQALRCVKSFASHFQRLMSDKSFSSKEVSLITILISAKIDGRILSALGGLLKSFNQESKKFHCRLISIADQHFSENNILISIIEKEKNYFGQSENPKNVTEVSVGEYDERYIRQWREIEGARTLFSSALKHGGVYWITGGLGGLGKIISNRVAETENIKIILSGRSELPQEGRELITSLKNAGSKVEYIRGDIGDIAQTKEIVTRILSLYGELSGIFHCAGVLRDGMLLKKNLTDFDEVFSGKVNGVENIDVATQSLKLDFILLCSSLAASTGNIGQSDYAAANAYLNGFSEYRNQLCRDGKRHGRTIAVNWPLWKDGGMQVDISVQKFQERRIGIVPLSTKDGLNALDALLLSEDDDSILVATGDSAKMKLTMNILDAKIEPVGEKASSKPEESKIKSIEYESSDQKNDEALQDDILEKLTSLLGLEKSDITPGKNFAKYGMDSINMMNLLSMLEESYDIPLDPSAIIDYPTVRELADYLVQEGAVGKNIKSRCETVEIDIPIKTNDKRPGQQALQEDLASRLSVLLQLSLSDIDLNKDFSKYGLDSINMMTMLTDLEEAYDLVLDPSAIIDYPTISELADYLTEEGVVLKNTNMVFEEPLADANTRSIERQEHRENNTKGNNLHNSTWREDKIESIDPDSGVRSRTAGNDQHSLERLVENKRTNAKNNLSKGEGHGRVAIIASACSLPQASNPQMFWDKLANGDNLFTTVPDDRWDNSRFFDLNRDARYATYSNYGGFIDDIFSFDADYFAISHDEAASIDPQHRFAMELSRQLFKNAGYDRDRLNNSSTCVYLGAKENNYLRDNYDLIPDKYLGNFAVNTIANMMPARISDFYNLSGSSKVIDTACSSSLVAIHDACQDIISGQVEMAVAGGVFLMLDELPHVAFSKAQVLAKGGRSYIFDERADGFILGEGGAMVLLKSYDLAVAENDNILAVINSSSVNNDGKTLGLTTPNLNAQRSVIESALDKAGITPNLISYFEAHGTGTLLGDPIEVKAATQAYRKYTSDKQYCAIGSVKSNLGHTMTAAGVVSLVKVLLSLSHKKIPPTLNCDKPHKRFQFEKSPFFPNLALRDWKPINQRRIAAISSFGFGGTNCHMLVEGVRD